ncbi:hypothetical protein [Jeotgalibacillus terrae]|uniref:Uncharacterized protein n=1 Tax=Jeotgalibacillus terrae TaxID=587735 RepID=A0ABW5ZHW7_9BACL|nr:hypothetical protein [Jeotgalibacillus terrae]MBM7579336.1 hypothetical protein [Jeotgalibacillus terrae]
MTIYRKGMTAIALTVLSGLFALKGFDILQTLENRDGAGTGVYFLIFEINDQVLWQHVPDYAYSFFIISLITFVSAGLMVKGIKPKKITVQ